MRDYIRIQRYTPYRPGKGPRFVLATWDTCRVDSRGQTRQAYLLRQLDYVGKAKWTTIFEGDDFCGSPLHADDSDDTLRALLGFLTLCPGDTDPEYFNSYTPEQLYFCAQHAGALGFFALGGDS